MTPRTPTAPLSSVTAASVTSAARTSKRGTPKTSAASGQLDPTDGWLAAVADMPPLTGPQGTAERLLLLLHYGIDWTGGWVGRYRATYWEELLPERVRVATFLHSDDLREWWCDVAEELQSAPRGRDERRELERLLRVDPVPVLAILRTQTPALLLRVRIVSEAVRTRRADAVTYISTVDDADDPDFATDSGPRGAAGTLPGPVPDPATTASNAKPRRPPTKKKATR